MILYIKAVTLKNGAPSEITNFQRVCFLKSIGEGEDSKFYFLYRRSIFCDQLLSYLKNKSEKVIDNTLGESCFK